MNNSATPVTTVNSVIDKEDEVDLLALLGILLDYKWWILASTLFFASCGVLYALLATPIYKAEALIQIEGKKAGLPGLADLAELTGKDPEAVTEIELIKSRWVVGRAVDSGHLDIYAEPKRFKFVGNFIARRFVPQNEGDIATAWLPFTGDYDWGGASISVAELNVDNALLNKPLTLVAGQAGKYQLLDQGSNLLLEGAVGQLAQAEGVSLLVDKLVAREGQFFTISRSSRLSVVDKYRADMQVAERGRQTGIIGLAYQHSNSVFARKVLDEIAQQYVKQNVERMSEEAAQSLKFVRDQLPQVRSEMERAIAELNNYQVAAKSADITSETQAVLDQVVDVEKAISEQELKKIEMEKRFTPEHPVYQTLIKQVAELKATRAELEKKIQGLPETQQKLVKLKRDAEVSAEIYTLLLNKSQELDIVRAGTVGNARIIDFAAVDTARPVSPKRALIVLLATLLGAAAGVILAGAHVALTRGVENPDDIEALGLPVNAAIPFSVLQQEDEKRADNTGTASLLALMHPTDPAVEAIRSLRTSLHFTMMDAPNNIMTITGPSPEVGKTFISVNLGVTMAQAGKKVLLIDADLRKGYMQRFFNVDSAHAGLANLLQKKVGLEQCLIETTVPGLSFLPRGPVPENPSELLLNPLFSQLLQHASKEYDLVIIDTPPILAVADALIVSKLAGANFIVARFNKNPLGEVQATIKRFEANGVKLNGAILNATVKRSLAYYGYQKYAYGNYQYSYYGVDKKAAKKKS